jgi:hypothetical protein
MNNKAYIRWDTFKHKISDWIDQDGLHLFRGQSNVQWSLETSYMRFCKATNSVFDIKAYQEMLESFIDKACDFLGRDILSLPVSAKLALARHHGLPTPILDWTESPYIATFFALWPRISLPVRDPFRIWVLHIENKRFVQNHRFDSNIFLQDDVFEVLRPKIFDSNRLNRQAGWFTSLSINSCLEEYLQRNQLPVTLERFDVAGSAWEDILCELNWMGIRAGVLFDNLDGIADDTILKYVLATCK